MPKVPGTPAKGSHELEQESRAVPEPISLARHCPRMDDGATVGEPIADQQHGATAHQAQPAAAVSFSD